MTYKLLSIDSIIRTKRETNIGDYIQALAASQFLPSVDGFIDRENLKNYDGEECVVIMNGWFMHQTYQWPPSAKIHPLFLSFHINSLAKEKLLSEESIRYLKAYEPIGCRDRNTADMLTARGVKAYFSGCLTLTLGFKFKSSARDGKYYFVDPCFYTKWNFVTILRNAIQYALHFNDVNRIARKYPSHKSLLRKGMILTTFYREYSKVFNREILLNAEYITQQSDIYNKYTTDDARLKEAERLVRCYARAKMVVSSRIHCALPCLGLETPVIFTIDKNQSEASSCRFGGLAELFNTLVYNGHSLEAGFSLPTVIDNDHIPQNLSSWQKLAEDLINSCKKHFPIQMPASATK